MKSAIDKEAVKGQACRLGFHLAGFTSPAPPPHLETYRQWIAAGRHGEMEYLATDRSVQRRADPQRILPGCKSILALAIHYPHPNSAPATGRSHPPAITGRVASYAWGEDYHRVLLGKMQSLVDYMESQLGHPITNLCYTDTGPIMERDLAQRAGLGWIGKNTCLINPRLGSFFFLAEILLGLEVEPDPPFQPDRCGTCTRCLDACPTQCILPDRTLDAHHCISYLTIEHKGAIPEEFRSALGNWVFGCDVCQIVCPWNRLAPVQVDAAFKARPEVPNPILTREVSLTSEAFARKFQGNPVTRAKRRGYLRNVAVALGNTHAGAARPAMERAARDPEDLVREHAAWALGEIQEETHE